MEEVTSIDIAPSGDIVDKIDKVALIDADTLIYASCFTLEVEEELLPKEYYKPGQYEELIKDPTYFEETNAVYTIDIDMAYQVSMDKIYTIMENTGCSDYELHFTAGKKSFRYTLIENEYKANRIGKRRPTGLRELRDLFAERQPERVTINTMWEADDAVISKMLLFPDKYILVAVDKDVLYSIPGTHYNYYQNLKYDIHMKWITVDEDRAMRHHYLQALMGDGGDNVIGLKGIGPKKAEKLLKNCTTEEECWDTVVKEHTGKKLKDGSIGSVDTALRNMRLVSMHQVNIVTGEITLWVPKQDR